MAAGLKLGRTPVREALKRLEADRLVVSFPRRGTFATGVDVADLRHISQIRVNLEPVAARAAADNASPAVRAHLLELADRTDALEIETIDRHELMRWDLRVHRAIYRATGNPHLEDVLIRYDNLATRIFCLFLDRLPTVAQHVGEHTELLRTIANGDGDAAAAIALRTRHGVRGSRPRDRLTDQGQLKTTVRCPCSSTRFSQCHRTARDSASASASWPTVARRAGLCEWSIRITSCSMIGPSSRSGVT